jgi:hypothetical protein
LETLQQSGSTAPLPAAKTPVEAPDTTEQSGVNGQTHKYDPHPLAATFPKNSKDIEALALAIKTEGLLEPITLYESKILDGRCRYEACLKAKVEPRFVDYTGSDPEGFVVSKNLARRHQTASSKAMWAAMNLLPKLEIQAKERQGERTDLKQHSGKVSGKSAGDARDTAARMVGVNPRYVSDAKALLDAAPYLSDHVLDGTLSLREAMGQASIHLRANKNAIKHAQNQTNWPEEKPKRQPNGKTKPQPAPVNDDEPEDTNTGAQARFEPWELKEKAHDLVETLSLVRRLTSVELATVKTMALDYIENGYGELTAAQFESVLEKILEHTAALV